jgi:hypothetical protein
MKRLGALAISLLLAASLSYSQKIAVKFGGGIGTSSGGDFTSGLLGMTKYLRDEYPGAGGEFSTPRFGLSLNGEIVYYFRKDMGIGLGIGYFGLSKDGAVTYTADIISAKEQLQLRFNVIPIALNFHYLVPLSNTFRLDLSAGVGGYLAKLDWNYQTDLSLRLPDDPSQVFNGSDTLEFESSRRFGLGLHGGASLEYAFSPRLAVCLNLTGRLASVSGFNGSWTEQGSGDFWDFSDSGTDAYLWSYDWAVNNTTYSQLVIQKETPAGMTISNARHARLGLSGFSAAIGIKIGLGR